MSKVLIGKHSNGEKYYLIECEGCEHAHVYDSRWSFNGDSENPTFTPSYLSKFKHPKGYSNDNPAPIGWEGEYVEEICHSFLTDGKLIFLDDCTHHLKGKTIELIDFD